MARVFVICYTLVFAGAYASAAPRSFAIIIERNMSCEDGSVNGRLLVEGEEIARTLEPALEGNRIPSGTYEAFIRVDGDLGWRVELKNVPGWENIQIHKGNYPSNTRGCVLVGKDVVAAKDKNTEQPTCVVTKSVEALADVRMAMQSASDNGVSNEALAITIILK